MSLINDALKKAQRSRSADPGELAPSPGGHARIAKRGVPLGARTILLGASGLLVLFVLAVVVTVYFLNRPSPTGTASVAKVTAPVTPATDGGSPVIVAPVITPPPPKADPAAPTQAQTPKHEPHPPPATKASTPEATGPAPKTAATPPPPPALPDERVHVFLDGLHVTAVRVQGTDSRVMIGERVFRLNDIVERSLGLRLSKVDSNQITFTDGNGVAYVKYF